jgi:hypothetical protein
MSSPLTFPLELNPKERVRRTLDRAPVDRLPTQCNYTAIMGKKLAEYFKVSLSELPARLGNHLLRVDVTYPKSFSDDGCVEFDWWGTGWSTETEGYWHSFAPLAHSNDLAHFPWPDPDVPHLLDGAASSMAAHRHLFVVPNLGMCLFARAWSLRGFDRLLVDMG